MIWRSRPRVEAVEITPKITSKNGKNPLSEGRFICCHGGDKGSPLQWAEWLFRTQVLSNPVVLEMLEAEAKARNGDVVMMLPLPMPDHTLLYDGKSHEVNDLRIHVRYLSGSNSVQWSSFKMSENNGTDKTIDQMETILGATRMRVVLPDGPKSPKIVMRFDATEPLMQQRPDQTIPFSTVPTSLRPEDMPPAKIWGRPVNKNVSKSRSRPKRVGRNQPCPCGSGKKYKYCCL
jgi:hypothetical protein